VKHIIPILLLVFLASCKDKKYCWRCSYHAIGTTYNNSDPGGAIAVITNKEDIDTCGMTQVEAEAYMREGTKTVQLATGSNTTVETEITTTCLKDE
jgi:hypothetical protein